MNASVVTVSNGLLEEARATNERRMLILAGDRERGYDALESVLDALSVPIAATTLVGPEDRLRCEYLPQAHSSELLGTTRDAIVLDAHDGLRPNALGRIVGAVDGGGLFIVLTPPLDAWPDRRGTFSESLAVPPASLTDVTGRFVSRVVETLRSHRGIAVVDVDDGTVEADGRTNPPPRIVDHDDVTVSPPQSARFPRDVYDACRTADQVEAVATIDALWDGRPRAAVLESNRGRGKSSACGLAAGAVAASGGTVLVTAPGSENAREVFDRSREICRELDELKADETTFLRTDAGGTIRYRKPGATAEACSEPDLVVVDEAGALSVSLLESLLEADRIAFATTIHGYEGAGRGFSVRFRDRLAASDHEVETTTLTAPIRYAGGDPLEVWAFRALLLDARPPVASLVEGATPETVEYRILDSGVLCADENLLREAFGLLVLAHYRTEPDDLARVLDAPNLETRALFHDGRVVSVALIAREGGLSEQRCARMYEGERIRGNMIPDLLTSQLRDERAGGLAGARVVRIATHGALRSRGLGSTLLDSISNEFGPEVDWLASGFGATPELVSFWKENGYRSVHLSTTRNDASGEHSAVMLRATSDAGDALLERHGRWFVDRFPAMCTDSLRHVDPDVLRSVLRSAEGRTARETTPVFSEREWNVLVGAADGPGLIDVNPGPARRLVMACLLDDPVEPSLTPREERLLVLRCLQAQPWARTADDLAYHSTGQCRRALGEALSTLLDRYESKSVRERFREERTEGRGSGEQPDE